MVSTAIYFGTRLRLCMASPVASHTSAFRSLLCSVIACLIAISNVHATNYTVSDKTTLQNRMTSALPGDTIIVANGTYNWGQIIFTNNNGTPASAWIVLKAQTFRGVTFTGTTYLQFKGTRVMIDGFRFANGSAGTNPVVSFRSSSSSLSSYCRITNIIIDNYNTYSADSSTENEWVALYGTNNRVDHCTFINKYNARATVVVWYSSTTYPNPANSTYHRIDSNYFNGRSYMGSNGGETIRVGDSNSSRTDGFNTIEYNLFEGMTQVEPEIISNKSDYNVYRYNTFKNCQGGLTLRHGRYCSVYGNFFIVDDPSVTQSYGIRIIDKGHKVYNNYIEAVNGNASGGTSQLRAPINLYNGVTTDSTDPAFAATYFPADSCIVAFNTIVNAKGGGGIILGGTGGGTFQPKGVVLANNLIKMATGTAVYQNPSNTSLTFSAEGNLYNAPSGLGISAAGFTNTTLSFGSRNNGMLAAPTVVQDAAVNTAAYISLLQNLDARSVSRSAVFDVGAEERNGTGSVTTKPVDSTMVGAGKPEATTLPVTIVQFTAQAVQHNKVQLRWLVAGEYNVLHYTIEWKTATIENASTAGSVQASGAKDYAFLHANAVKGKNSYRLKVTDADGTIRYSQWVAVNIASPAALQVYPNPAKDKINIRTSDNLPQPVIVVMDVSGKILLRRNLLSAGTTINTNAWAKGGYLLQLQSNNTIIITQPLIIE